MLSPFTQEKWLKILSRYITGDLASDQLGSLLLYFLNEQIEASDSMYDEIVGVLNEMKDRYIFK